MILAPSFHAESIRMRVWVGYHPKIGAVIFDPVLQSEVDTSQVRLWDISRQELKLFHKDTVKQDLRSLQSHLIVMGLQSLVIMHGIVGQVAERYFQHRPVAPTSSHASLYSSVDEDWGDIEPDDERVLLHQELNEEQDAWARSEEEGWFYED
jgi:hypothetical protein